MTLDPLVEKWINLEISPEKLLTIALVFWLVSFGAIWRALDRVLEQDAKETHADSKEGRL